MWAACDWPSSSCGHRADSRKNQHSDTGLFMTVILGRLAKLLAQVIATVCCQLLNELPT